MVKNYYYHLFTTDIMHQPIPYIGAVPVLDSVLEAHRLILYAVMEQTG
jgi:hypothetical protein